jgi:hypothetical protein
MSFTPVQKDQFERRGNEIIHRPTGARFGIKDGITDFTWRSGGVAGARLPNGQKYHPSEIEAEALQFLRALQSPLQNGSAS